MNEPQSVAAEMLTLTVLLQSVSAVHHGGPPKFGVGDIKPLKLEDSVLYPPGAPANILMFNYLVPRNTCLLVTYIAAQSTPTPISGAATPANTGVSFGFYPPFNVALGTTPNGVAFNALTAAVLQAPTVLNTPILFVWNAGQTMAMQVSLPDAASYPEIGVNGRRQYFQATAYLLPDEAYSELVRFRTNFIP